MIMLSSISKMLWHIYFRIADEKLSRVSDFACHCCSRSDHGACENTCALCVPDLPLKLRLLVRTETESVQGDMLLPMQKPQEDSRILAPKGDQIAQSAVFSYGIEHLS